MWGLVAMIMMTMAMMCMCIRTMMQMYNTVRLSSVRSSSFK